MEQLLGPDHSQRACPYHLPHLFQQQVFRLFTAKYKEQEWIFGFLKCYESVLRYQGKYFQIGQLCLEVSRYQSISKLVNCVWK